MPDNIIILCAVCFISAFVDSISGGGSLISIPAFLLAGIPPYMALGTNKFASGFSTLSSVSKFAQSKKVDFKILKYLIPFCLIGSAIGVNTVLIINASCLNVILMILLLLVGIYSLFSREAGMEDKFQGISRKNLISAIVLSLILGFYDGFLGAGVGTFLIFGLISIFKFDFVRAGGNAKVMNFAGNIAAILMFAVHGQIDYKTGIPVALVMIIGARLGTKAALFKGAKLVKPVFIAMTLAVAGKFLYTVLA